MPRFDRIDADSLRRRGSAKWSRCSGDLLAASVADMDFHVAEPISRALAAMIETSDLGYPTSPTPEGLATIFARRMRERFAWDVDPDRVEILTDVMQALHIALGEFSEAGDPVVTPTPVYPPFLEAVAATKRVPVWLRYERVGGRFEADVERMQRELPSGTRMLLLCNPHNPTGRVLERGDLEAIAAIAIERDLVVVSDEIHADLIYPGVRHIPLATLGPEIAARTITLTSATKAFNIAGLRCAVAVFGSPEMQRRFSRVDRHIRGGLNTLGLAATAAAWSEGQPWQDEVMRCLEANRDHVAERVRGWRGVVHARPEATYLSWLDFRALELAPTPFEFFSANAHVLLAAGEGFGEPGRGFARLNFATSRPVLDEILDRMSTALGA